MKRHRKLIKLILKYTELHATGDLINPPEIDDYSDAEVQYHVQLCQQAGYLLAKDTSGSVLIHNLTWEGHEELDRLRKNGCQGE